MANDSFFTPDWDIPDNVHALCTTRLGGSSAPPFGGFNLASHVGDDQANVNKNRASLMALANLPQPPAWLDQQHTNHAIELKGQWGGEETADASWSTTSKHIATVMTADCLPLLLTSFDGNTVAAIHAGWKGLADGIISETLSQLPCPPHQLSVWIGPAISVKHFEVGQDVVDAFIAKNPHNQTFFTCKSTQPQKYMADLPAIAEAELNALGVKKVQQSRLCSFEESALFYSYRRDGQTGRMASLIWKD